MDSFFSVDNAPLLPEDQMALETNSNLPDSQEKGIMPMFFYQAVYDEQASSMTGRPVYENVEMVRFLIAGDKGSIPVLRVNDSHIKRFPKQYAAFRKQTELLEDESYTPLESWSALDPAKVAQLKAINILSVDQLASVTDGNLHALGMGGSRLRDMARAFIEAAETGSTPVRLVQENEMLKNDITMLKKQMESMALKMEATLKEQDIPLETVDTDVTVQGVEEVTKKSNDIEIPGNYTSLGLKSLQEICSDINSTIPIRTKKDGIALIDEYLKEM